MTETRHIPQISPDKPLKSRSPNESSTPISPLAISHNLPYTTILEMSTPELKPGTEVFTLGVPNYSELSYHIRIDAMTSDEKLDWLSNHILKQEHHLLREPHNIPQIRPEAKIMFLTGGPKSDVTEARDFDGNLIHTRHLDHPRPMFAEIPEALASISHWFDLTIESKRDNTAMPTPVPPLSEVADVVYNISHLLTLDPNFSDNYTEYLDRIAGSLGFNLDQLLTLTVYKYNFRLGQGKSQKNIAVENGMLEKVISQKDGNGTALYPMATESQFQKTFHTLSEVQALLNTRLEQLRQEYEWQADEIQK